MRAVPLQALLKFGPGVIPRGGLGKALVPGHRERRIIGRVFDAGRVELLPFNRLLADPLGQILVACSGFCQGVSEPFPGIPKQFDHHCAAGRDVEVILERLQSKLTAVLDEHLVGEPVRRFRFLVLGRVLEIVGLAILVEFPRLKVAEAQEPLQPFLVVDCEGP